MTNSLFDHECLTCCSDGADVTLGGVPVCSRVPQVLRPWVECLGWLCDATLTICLYTSGLSLTGLSLIMGQHDHQQDEEAGCDVFSEESLSRSDSVDQLSLHQLDDGSMEERFRVDRRKLEAMILGELITRTYLLSFPEASACTTSLLTTT